MRILVDTNLLLRFSDPKASQHTTAVTALDRLDQEGHELRTVPQNFYEYWVVGTRPLENNGLGFTPQQLEPYLDDFNALFPLLRDERTVFDHWHKLVLQFSICGKQAHDARIVAAMHRHDLTHLLTFDTGDFKRYTAITVIDPNDVWLSTS